MNMMDLYKEKVRELKAQGYTIDDLDQIAEENFLPEEAVEGLYDAFVALEDEDEDDV